MARRRRRGGRDEGRAGGKVFCICFNLSITHEPQQPTRGAMHVFFWAVTIVAAVVGGLVVIDVAVWAATIALLSAHGDDVGRQVV